MERLKKLAYNIRYLSLEAIYEAGSGHPGGSLSIADILAILYDEFLTDDDKVILSKGHACPAWYAAMACKGMLERDEVLQLRKYGAKCQGHPSKRHLPEVKTSTGSLGQGLSYAVGLALGMRAKGQPGRVYCLCGEGDLHEGMSIEAMRFAGQFNLENLTVIADLNGIQSDEHSINFTSAYEFSRSDWWTDTCNGHNFGELRTLLGMASTRGEPSMILAVTKKGKGVDEYEQHPAGMHGSVTLSKDDLERALEQLQ
jgi:transketolase